MRLRRALVPPRAVGSSRQVAALLWSFTAGVSSVVMQQCQLEKNPPACEKGMSKSFCVLLAVVLHHAGTRARHFQARDLCLLMNAAGSHCRGVGGCVRPWSVMVAAAAEEDDSSRLAAAGVGPRWGVVVGLVVVV